MPSPPKPYEKKLNGSGSSSSPLPIQASHSNSVGLNPSGSSPNLSLPSSSPTIPPRPSLTNYSSPYSSNSYSRYSPYGSSYGGSYGSSYGGYGMYGSRFGGYPSYSGYGSRYSSPLYGSSSSLYGSSNYGGYGSFDQRSLPPQNQGSFQSFLDTGLGKLRGFGDVVEAFARFSNLLDANFDAVHTSFTSIIRVIDVFGEFLYVIRSFTIFRIVYAIISRFWKSFSWLFRNSSSLQSNTPDSSFINDYAKYQNEQKQKNSFPFTMIMFGIAIIFGPSALIKFWNSLKAWSATESLDDLWGSQLVKVKAKFDFQGQNEMDLSFRKDEVFVVTNKPFPEWWEGELHGRRGLFPAQFVDIIETPKKKEPSNLPNFEKQDSSSNIQTS